MMLAEAHEIYCRKVVAVGQVGFPDLFLARYGRIILVEVKSPTGKGRLSKKQQREIERLKNAGIKVYVIEDYEGADNVIKQFADA
jgi:hypothetical protein